MARPLHVSCETRHFYSWEYYWSKYHHDENHWESHIDVNHPDEPQMLQPLRQTV